MGKTKQKRKSNRNRPTGLPSVKEVEKDELLEESPGKYQSLLEKLQSASSEKKECAACTIANLVNRPEAVTFLLNANIVKIAGPLLVDPSHVVRHATTGALRNLSLVGPEVCREMIGQDVLTPLVALLRQYAQAWRPAKSAESKIDSKKETFLEAVNLLWNLCENSEIAVDTVIEQQLLPILLFCLDVQNFGVEVCIVVAQFLNTVSEDNCEIIDQLNKPEVLELIHSLMSLPENDPPYLLLRALASGLMLNIYSGQLGNCPPVTVTIILNTIAEVVRVEVGPLLKSLAEMISNYKMEKKNNYKTIMEIEKSEELIEKTLSQLCYVLNALYIILELITNLCTLDDDIDKWENISSSDEMNDVLMDDDNDDDDGDETNEFHKILSIPCELQEVIVNQALLQKILCFAAGPAIEIVTILQSFKPSKSILKRIQGIRYRSLLCVSNIVQCLDIEDMGGIEAVSEIWINLARLAFKETGFEIFNI